MAPWGQKRLSSSGMLDKSWAYGLIPMSRVNEAGAAWPLLCPGKWKLAAFTSAEAFSALTRGGWLLFWSSKTWLFLIEAVFAVPLLSSCPYSWAAVLPSCKII
jgi:hypothetical protein